MRHRHAITVGALLLALLGTGARKDPADTHRLVDRWAAPEIAQGKFQKLLVIGIAADIDARKRFENKFVSHLRGRQIEGVTSYSLVPDLTAIEDERAIVQAVRELGVDGAISVRVVPLKDTTESAWGEQWRAEVQTAGDLRAMIDASLPVTPGDSKQYGVEVALWETGGWTRIWGARTNPYTRKQMKAGAGAFVQDVMAALRSAELL